MSTLNRAWTLASRPQGMPTEANFKLVESRLPSLKDGQLLLKALYLSVDPYMRGRISGAKSYAKPVEVGETIVGGGVAEVVESRHADWKPGDVAEIYMGWQEFAISDGAGLRRIDPALAPVSTALGVLGMPGFTAYFGLLDVCDPKAGETVLVSGAAGAVGTTVGQIAKILGCRVVGIAGSDDKVNYLTGELGFDAAYNYRETSNHVPKLRELCPNGIDCYFDNVGGTITDAAILTLNVHGRVCICGQISQYNNTAPEMGPRLLGQLIVTRSKIQGMLVGDYASRFPEAAQRMGQWVKEGRILYREDIVDGFENMPQAFFGLFTGENTGKRLVKLL
jgi:leukotriene B4 12-hydroxydehydrogenase/15-oxo-prostaglandin 13-reductase